MRRAEITGGSKAKELSLLQTRAKRLKATLNKYQTDLPSMVNIAAQKQVTVAKAEVGTLRNKLQSLRQRVQDGMGPQPAVAPVAAPAAVRHKVAPIEAANINASKIDTGHLIQAAPPEAPETSEVPEPAASEPSSQDQILLDPTALQPGQDWWNRPNPSPLAPSSRPLAWNRDKEQDLKRYETITRLITTHSDSAREAGHMEHSQVLQAFAASVKGGTQDAKPPPGLFADSGVVICGGGIVYFSSALVVARTLRALGCYLPVEIWVTAGEAVPDDLSKELEYEGIFICDASDIIAKLKDVRSKDRFYELKPVAMAYSRFRKVLLLDADNIPVRNPEPLWHSDEYLRSGALFWPDFPCLEKSNKMWKLIDKPFSSGMTQESGQILIDKAQHWGPLLLVVHMNLEHEYYYPFTGGDKETFHYAWRALDASFIMTPTPVGSAGEGSTEEDFQGFTMVQHGLNGEPLFFHRNLKKWTTGFTGRLELQEQERTWVTVKECVAEDPAACFKLVGWKDGLMTMKDKVGAASTRTRPMSEAAGWDVEAALMRAFVHLYDSPHYTAYMHSLIMANGPAGSYHVTCKRCHMLKEAPSVLTCDCEGIHGKASPTKLPNAMGCMNIDNNNGKLECLDNKKKEKRSAASGYEVYGHPAPAEGKSAPATVRQPTKPAGILSAKQRPPDPTRLQLQPGMGHTCADEGGVCNCVGTAVFGRKYVMGKPGSGIIATLGHILQAEILYKRKEVDSSVKCTVAAFGGELLPGYSKQCICVPKADTKAPVPEGSYSSTCKECSMLHNEPTTLVCHCQNSRGKYVMSRLKNASACDNIGNSDGSLSCEELKLAQLQRGFAGVQPQMPTTQPPRGRMAPLMRTTPVRPSVQLPVQQQTRGRTPPPHRPTSSNRPVASMPVLQAPSDLHCLDLVRRCCNCNCGGGGYCGTTGCCK